ncbi:MAG: endonuclease/exonuclease/phosphatase family protein [Alistipes sp.]|nr:endonuclease/exonuclease/phosphatase family protein [Candidatus Alistipes equi]
MKRILIFCFALGFIAFCATAEELNVGSYNIRLETDVDYNHNDGWLQRRGILCDLIRFSNFDIFGAQEVRHAQLEYMLEKLPEYDYIGVGRDDGATAGEYSPVFYKRDRFKVLDKGTFWISPTPDKVSYGWDAKCRRVCSWGHFKDLKTKTRFYFFNLHMDHRGVKARREGAKLIVKKIKEMCTGKDANFVVTGDFNVAQDNEIFQIFVDSGIMKDSFECADFRFSPTGTFNSFDPSKFTKLRIDHIWVSSAAHVSRYGVLTYHYWLDKKGEDSSSTLVAAPKEMKTEKREVHLPSDHYPLSVFLSF